MVKRWYPNAKSAIWHIKGMLRSKLMKLQPKCNLTSRVGHRHLSVKDIDTNVKRPKAEEMDSIS